MASQRDNGKALSQLEEWRKTTEKGFFQVHHSELGWEVTLFPMTYLPGNWHMSGKQPDLQTAVNVAINKAKGMKTDVTAND